jgi:sugar/nucleoside kinase (ribokinase family)
MKKIIGIGNALVDVLIKLENDHFLEEYNIPKGSMQLVQKDFVKLLSIITSNNNPQLASGGSASNTIHGLASLGVKTSYIGKIGNDAFGKIFSDDLEKNKIVPILYNSENETGRAITFISPDSERTFATYLGAAVELSAADLQPNHFDGYDYLHIEGYLVLNHELVEKALKIAKSKGLKISLDLASYNVVDANRDFLQHIIKEYIDIVFANEEEAKSLTGLEPEWALRAIARLCDIAVVKFGAKGSAVKRGNELARASAVKANAIDTTGAGDLYASGFLYGLMNDWSLKKCVELGSITAGKVVEVIGAKINNEGWNDIRAELKKLEISE